MSIARKGRSLRSSMTSKVDCDSAIDSTEYRSFDHGARRNESVLSRKRIQSPGMPAYKDYVNDSVLETPK